MSRLDLYSPGVIPSHPAATHAVASAPAFEAIARELLRAMGLDPSHASIAGTPGRVARMWRDFLLPDPGLHPLTSFHSAAFDQMVVVRGIRVWSFCEHHLLPFWCDITIGVLASGTVLGLSKYARIAQACARQLQIQERLVTNIADAVARAADTDHVAVLASGEHLCMTMRGAKSDAQMATSITRGKFRDDARARQEFLHLAT